jgi:hypothetical protein
MYAATRQAGRAPTMTLNTYAHVIADLEGPELDVAAGRRVVWSPSAGFQCGRVKRDGDHTARRA